MDPELILKASKGKASGHLVVSALTALLGGWLAQKSPIAGWACVAFGVAGTMISAFILFTDRVYLRLTAHGLESHNLFRTNKYAWGDFLSIGMRKVKWGRVIAFTVVDKNVDLWFGVNPPEGNPSPEGWIMNNYDLTLEALFEILVEWHARYKPPIKSKVVHEYSI
jgi:hypothetical protein